MALLQKTKGGVRMNIFQKVKTVRELVNAVYPILSLVEIKEILQFLANNWHGNKQKKHTTLTQQQLAIYELLINNSYNPATVYKWFLLATAPPEIKEKMAQEQISIRDALREKRKLNNYVSTTEQEFINAVISFMEKYLTEAGENYPGKVKG